MIRLYADQLSLHLQGLLRPYYLLFGNDLLLLQESQDNIRDQAKKQHFDEHFSFTLDAGTDWNMIFNICQTRSLFSSRQTLLLILPDCDINQAENIGRKLFHLISLLHDDLLLILRGSKITRALENTGWFKALRMQAVLVNCATPDHEQFPRWVAKRAKNMKLSLDNATCQLLCYYYEGNLLGIVQALQQLSLIYPDGNLTLPRVNMIVNNAMHFTPFNLVDAVLEGKSKRATHILRQLQLEATEPVILLRNIQREVLQLLMLKRKATTTPTRILFDHYKVWQNRRPLLTRALERFTLPQLRDAVTLMAKIELALKQDNDCLIWSNLNTLVLLLCGKKLHVAISYV